MNHYLISLVIILGVVISIGYNPHYDEVNYVLIPAFLLTMFGFIYKITYKKVFAYVAMIGFVFFVPIGLIGVYAMRNMVDNHARLLFKRALDNEDNSHG